MALKPLKRNINLVPFSREHHDGLMLCLKIKQGIARNIDISRISAYLVYYFGNFLKEHFLREEKLLLEELDTNDLHRIQVESEHGQLYGMLKQIEEKPSAASVEEFGRKLEQHIRYEERVFYPYLEKLFTKEQLQEIGAGLNHIPACGLDQWNDRFWM